MPFLQVLKDFLKLRTALDGPRLFLWVRKCPDQSCGPHGLGSPSVANVAQPHSNALSTCWNIFEVCSVLNHAEPNLGASALDSLMNNQQLAAGWP